MTLKNIAKNGYIRTYQKLTFGWYEFIFIHALHVSATVNPTHSWGSAGDKGFNEL
jgi:hypothetical protein